MDPAHDDSPRSTSTTGGHAADGDREVSAASYLDEIRPGRLEPRAMRRSRRMRVITALVVVVVSAGGAYAWFAQWRGHHVAEVELLETHCSGTPIPRPATTLRVEVTVNQGGLVRSHLGELWTIFWAEALGFWKWLVGFLFLAVIAVVRKRMAQHPG